MKKIIGFIFGMILLIGIISATINYRIFVTSGEYDGNFGGTVGADAICQTEGNLIDNTRTWKAIIGSSSPDRWGAPDIVDWPLQINTNYYTADGLTFIDKTDSDGRFTFNLDNPINTNYEDEPWTGLNTDFSLSSDDCNSWTDNTESYIGNRGDARSITNSVLHSTNDLCVSTHSIYCVCTDCANVAPDTCTYTSGIWNINWSDNCVITTNVDLNGNDMYLKNGAGTFTILGGNITNTGDIYLIGDGATVSFNIIGGNLGMWI